MRWLRTLRPAHVALLVPWVVAVVAGRLPLRDNSFLWHVRAGTLQLDTGRVLTSDPFSFTFPDAPWRTQAWLLELGYGWLERIVGLGFVPWLVAACGIGAFALVSVAVYRRTRSVEATALMGGATAWLGAAFLNPRPVLVSFLFLAAVVVVGSDRRLRWTLPLIAWVWASVHASFLVGLGYVALDGLRRRDRRALADPAAMALFATLGAHGLGVWEILQEFAGSRSALRLITEWATPNFTGVENLPFLLGLLLLVYGAIRARVAAAELWVVAPFLAFGMAASRSVFPAWIALAPPAATGLAGLPRGSGRASSPVVIGVAAGAVLAIPFLVPVTAGSFAERFPVEAARHLTAQRVFHDDVVGGYLVYAQWPERRVFVDDRAELFGAEHFTDTVEARNGTPSWRETFDRWGIEQALVGAEEGLAVVLADDGWTERFRDDDFVVLDRP
jgi:hypothetical protein